jgi:hypothetical protein
MADEEKRKRGRPPLSPELKAERAAARKEYNKAYLKAHGFAAQRKYDKTEKGVAARRNYVKKNAGKRYAARISIPASKKDVLLDLVKSSNMSINKFFVSLVEEKYNVDLS